MKTPEKIYYHKGKLRTPFAVEQNALIETERAEYHRKRAEESPAYKAACEAIASLAYDKQVQMAQVCSAISGGGYTKVEKPKPSIIPQDVPFDEYYKALKEYLMADIEFDKKLIKKSGFEW